MSALGRINAIASKVFEVDVATAANIDYLFDFPNWDSFAQVAFISEIEKEFGVELDPTIVFQLFTKEDVLIAIRMHNLDLG